MKLKFRITGMHCAACSAAVERAVKKLDGVSLVQVDLLSGLMTCEAEESREPLIRNAIIKAGFEAERLTEVPASAPVAEELPVKRRLVISLCLLVPLMYLSMAPMGLWVPAYFLTAEGMLLSALLQLLLSLSVLIVNRVFFKRGIPSLLRGSPNMDTLVSLSALASVGYGIWRSVASAALFFGGNASQSMEMGKTLYFESSAMILTLVTLGKTLEARAKRKTGDAIKALSRLAPEYADVLRENKEQRIPAGELRVGDVFIVRPGERICADGVVKQGHALVDESALTGESLPAEKSTGDFVISASVNQNGVLYVEAQRVGDQTTLSSMIELVRSAGATKAPVARLADKVSGVFVPVVMGISLCTLGIWLLLGKEFSFALNSAVSVLVISCPCSLGLATPVAITVSMGRCARGGILIKNAEALQKLSSVDTVLFDKTGTLTTGNLSLTDVLFTEDKEALLTLAGGLEQNSEHPVAKAICESGGEFPTCADFSSVPGKGVWGIINGAKIFGGKWEYLRENGVRIENAQIELAKTVEAEGKTVVWFGQSGALLGAVALSDTPRGGARDAIHALECLRVRTVMLTGDNENAARAKADALGIREVIAGVLPTAKAAEVKKERSRGQRVAMVGDGINDAPALTEADVGIAMGGGTDIARMSADAVLLSDDPRAVADAILFGKKTLRNVKQNLFWAFFYNCIAIPIGALGLLTPVIASVCMSCSSLFVVTNALRLYKMKGSDR